MMQIEQLRNDRVARYHEKDLNNLATMHRKPTAVILKVRHMLKILPMDLITSNGRV